MENEIKAQLDQPQELEKLYRANKAQFRKAFAALYPEIAENPVARVWQARLSAEHPEVSWGKRNELLLTVLLAAVAGLTAKLPVLFGIDEEFFYSRNMSFIVFPVLVAYFVWRQGAGWRQIGLLAATLLVAGVYINLLPHSPASDSIALACIHLPLFMWAVLGYSFVGTEARSYGKRIDYLRYNADLVVIGAVLLLAGVVLSGVTVGLFSLIGLNIERFYFPYVVVFGLAATPVVGTYLVQTNPQLVKNVSPIIAKVFTPLVLVMLVAYLVAILYTGKDPYTDRDFLLLFNLLLVGVMAIILFSVAESAQHGSGRVAVLLLLLLAVVTVVLNGIALSAIVFRISEWGITPNRLAVLGGNVLILINLMWVTYRLFGAARHTDSLPLVERSIAAYLPVYTAWTLVVVVLFPILFQFK